MHISQSTNYIVNSEGTALRTAGGSGVTFARRRMGLATDGTQVRDARGFPGFQAGWAAARRRAGARRQGARRTCDRAERRRRPAKPTTARCLFEAPAAAQLFGQLLGDNLKVTRKPVDRSGAAVALHRRASSKIEIGSRILPDWMDVVDDPTLNRISRPHAARPLRLRHGRRRAAAADAGGKRRAQDVPAHAHAGVQELSGFEWARAYDRFFGDAVARLRQFVYSRVPDHARRGHEARSSSICCKKRNKPYGILIRKLDFPSTASIEELRQVSQARRRIASRGASAAGLQGLPGRAGGAGARPAVSGFRRGRSKISWRHRTKTTCLT